MVLVLKASLRAQISHIQVRLETPGPPDLVALQETWGRWEYMAPQDSLADPYLDKQVLWEIGEFKDPKGTKENQVRSIQGDPHRENLENQDALDYKD